jgi:ribosomal protein L15
VPALSLFSFSVVAGAKVSQSKVVPQGHDDGHGSGDGNGNGNGNHGNGGQGQGGQDNQGDDDGTLVVVDSSHGDGGISDLFGKRGHEICWISKSQLVRVSAVYRTTTSTLKVGKKTYSLVTVYGADDRTLRQLLGTSAVQCKLVRVAHLYFLPFDPNLS